MKSRQWLGVGIGAAIVAALLTLALHDPGLGVALADVRAAPLRVSLQEEGKTRLKQRYLISAPVTGTLRRIDREPGDTVTRGEVVAELEPLAGALMDPQTKARASAEAASAEASVRAARGRVHAAEAALKLAEREARRLTDMRDAVSASQRETAAMKVDQQAAERTAALADLAATEQRAEAARAVLALQGSGAGDQVLTLEAPIDGVILRRFQESRAVVAGAQPLLEIGDPRALEIEVEALSTVAVQLHEGIAARVLRWGGDDALEARVMRVEPGAFTKISALGVEEQRTRVILELLSPPERWTRLGDAYRVEIEFLLREEDAVLQVPSNALFRAQGRWAVFVVEEGRARQRVVVIGDRAGLVTEIRSGLKPGERVVQHPDDRVAEGARVRSIAD
ncbi:MAG TPA: HlyD family efflux transporter periplasmic adaptor subunit [Patescibacteria group bacterium]|nr:HlyD family efflux transporter periplasmic adaptor subunit [Patescibacteria group bacterium]